jgi:hypothetical protein
MRETQFHDRPIQIDNFATYLLQHGWQKVDRPNPRLLVFQFIPDPPDRDNPANFAGWVSPSDRSEKELKFYKYKPWWKIW